MYLTKIETKINGFCIMKLNLKGDLRLLYFFNFYIEKEYRQVFTGTVQYKLTTLTRLADTSPTGFYTGYSFNIDL